MARMTDDQFKKLDARKVDQPPAWAKGAIATNAGWVNPRTREVLFAHGGLARLIQAYQEEKRLRDAGILPEKVTVQEVPISNNRRTCQNSYCFC